VRKPARDRRLVARGQDLLGQRLPSARAGKAGTAVELAVLDPT
jgi:hypothetical protein